MLRVLLMFSAIETTEVMAWADEQVLADAVPSEWALELAASKDSPKAIYEALLRAPRTKDAGLVLANVLPKMGQAVKTGRLTARAAADALESLAIDEYAPYDMRPAFYYFADAYRASDEGFGAPEQVDGKVISYLTSGGQRDAV